MVTPGVTTRNPRVNRELPGRRTALMVCQATTIAMTVVLPAPVASFRASRASPGFASSLACSRSSRIFRSSRPSCGATSVSQMTVSTASTWQKNGRMSPKWWLRQCRSSRAVSGVTRHEAGSGSSRQRSTRWRTLLMNAVRSYCWVSDSSACAGASKTIFCCPCFCFLGLGIGVMNATCRRLSTTRFVGCPLASSSQWREGYS